MVEDVIDKFLQRAFPEGAPLNNPRGYMQVKENAKSTAMPMSKRLLTADHRMMQELRRIGMKPEEIEALKAAREKEKVEKEEKKMELLRKKEQRELEKKAREDKKVEKEKEKRAKEEQKEIERQKKEDLEREREETKKRVEEKKRIAAARKEDAKKAQKENEHYIRELRRILAEVSAKYPDDDEKVEPAEAESDEKKDGKKKRAAANGPMTVAFNSFMKEQKEMGIKWQEALQKWKVSEQRSEIVSTMSEAERKRRRYD